MTFADLALIVACGLVGPLLAGLPRFAPPVVVGEIAAGVVLGRTGVGVIDPSKPTLAFFAEVGFALLMFSVGTALPLRDPGLRSSLGKGVRVLAISAVLALAVGFGLAQITNLHRPLMIAILAVTSSAALVMPALEEAGLTQLQIGLVTAAWVTLADIGSVVALPVRRRARVLAQRDDRRARGAGRDGGDLGGPAHRAPPGVVPALPPALAQARVGSGPADLAAGVVHPRPGWRSRSAPASWSPGSARARSWRWSANPSVWSGRSSASHRAFSCRCSSSCSGAQISLRALVTSPGDLLLAVTLSIAIVAVHVVAGLIARLPLGSGLVATAQMGVPAALVAVGLETRILTPGQAAAILAATLVSVGVMAVGARRLAAEVSPASVPDEAASAA